MKHKLKFLLLFGTLLAFSTNTVLATDLTSGTTSQTDVDSKDTKSPENNQQEEPAAREASTSKCVYLSDLSYDPALSKAEGKHSIHLDENDSCELIALKVNNQKKTFIKGLCAWATSEIVYDLTDYTEYTYFTAYLGVDYSEQKDGPDDFNTGVKFYIYTSNDAATWTEVYHSDTLKGTLESANVKVPLNGAKYLKLVADDNSDSWWAAWYDEAVYADAKLISENYEEDKTEFSFIKSVSEYDKILKTYSDYNLTGEYELTLLQREFVKKADYEHLQALARYRDDYKETLNWLMNDAETLRLYLVGGKPQGNYVSSIKVLNRMYQKYKDSDLVNTGTTTYGTKYSDLYRTMILACSLEYSGEVYFWMPGNNGNSDPVTRYEIYKKMHLHKGQDKELIENKIFESLTVEEMRWVMNTIIDDEEIEWLNSYVRKEGKGAISPYNYIHYTFDYDDEYALDKYYSQENYDKWNAKYRLSEFNITYKKGYPKLWIVFEEGSVCGGLSKTGSCIWGAYKGLPNTCVSQPAHCAYVYYDVNDNGDGIWYVGNDVSGWGQSGKTEHLNTRMMNDWGDKFYTDDWFVASYILLAQGAQNEYSSYESAEKLLMLADVYDGDLDKLETIYRKALKAEKINFDAWLGLIDVYEQRGSKTTEADYYKLAQEIVDALTYYPYPMNDLLLMIEPHFTSIGYETMFTLLQTRALEAAASATDQDSIQASAVKHVANQLLGNIDTSIASFSFDGANAGKIILSDRYADSDLAWKYSLDGGKNWTQTEKHEVQLSEAELESITVKDDIKIYIVGVVPKEENYYTIDIQESAGIPKDLYANDMENKLIGATDSMQWKYISSQASQSDLTSGGWTFYRDKAPDLSGDKTILVRMGATGVYRAETNDMISQNLSAHTFCFTADKTDQTKQYISIDHLSIEEFSSEQAKSDDAVHAIDGNLNTIWHTSHNGDDKDRYIVIKTDEPILLSALQYIPRQSGNNGRAKNVTIYASMDGKSWTKVGEGTNWADNADAKMIELADAVKTQYVKFVVNENHGDGRSFASAAMLNLFEDLTKKATPTAKIAYNITESTTGSVTAKLVNPSTEITITNNDGKDTYTFTKNGEFTFEFVDKYGNKGSAVAKVDWITTDSGNDDQKPDDDSNKDDNSGNNNTSKEDNTTSKDNTTNSSSSTKKDNKKTNPIIKVPKKNSGTTTTTNDQSTKNKSTSDKKDEKTTNDSDKKTETEETTKETEEETPDAQPENTFTNETSESDTTTTAPLAETDTEQSLLDRLKQYSVPLAIGFLALVLILSIFLIRGRKKKKLSVEDETPPTDTPPTETVSEAAPLIDDYANSYPPIDYPSHEYFPEDYPSDHYPQ